MRTIMSFLSKSLGLAFVCLAWTACSSDGTELELTPTGRRTIKMNLVGEVVGFDQTTSSNNSVTRGETSASWTDGDKIFITLYNGTTIVPGEATYNSVSGWSVSFDGILAAGDNQKCEARHFVNATYSSSLRVTLDSNTEIYEDTTATYSYNNDELTVMATMIPKAGRIRFTGTEGCKIYITGLAKYATFAPTVNQFTTTDLIDSLIVGSDGSTPYIYGYFSDEERRICVAGEDFAFTRNCDAEILKTGESGYMAIPSDSSHYNWRSGMYIKVNGVEFKMIPVAGHESGPYLIGETEVTEELYDKVKDSSSTSTSQYPKTDISISTATSWKNNLNTLTKLNFSLPNSEQWQYAAMGGNKSLNYTFAGSNTADDVAWYSENSNNEKHPVKQKMPNELGIYDMNGNVAEWTTSHTTNQWGIADEYYYWGGSYYSSGVSVSSYSGSSDEPLSSVGFRLILTLP